MDDTMYDMQGSLPEDGAGQAPVKRRPVRPAELRLDDSKENLGLERVDYGYLSPYLETQETPADRVARRLIATPSMHSHRDDPQWWSLPVGHIGRIKAQKTAARWARARTLDGRTVKFSAVAFPIRDSDKNLWGRRHQLRPRRPTGHRTARADSRSPHIRHRTLTGSTGGHCKGMRLADVSPCPASRGHIPT